MAICASVPRAKGRFPSASIVETLAGQYFKHAGHDVTLHLFTDVADRPNVVAPEGLGEAMSSLETRKLEEAQLLANRGW